MKLTIQILAVIADSALLGPCEMRSLMDTSFETVFFSNSKSLAASSISLVTFTGPA